MDDKAKKLLNRIQADFPLESRPFLTLAKKLQMTEDEVINLVKKLKEEGYLRRLGGIFDSRSLGYTSRLCAMEVAKDQIEQTAELVNSYQGVTHNYLRDHQYNMWFTLIASSEDAATKMLEEIKQKSGISEIMVLDALRTFKIKVNFHLEGAKECGGARPSNY